MSEEIPALHQRVADRVYDLLTGNGGLYIKIGQAIGNNAALLPAPIQEKFAKLFDDAPQVPYSVVRSVLKAEYGREPAGPDGIFEVFEEQAVASASVAQVHRAKLKSDTGDGAWVAVKVQKPAVSRQVEWDLGAFRIVMWIYENYLFDMPVYFVVGASIYIRIGFSHRSMSYRLYFGPFAQRARLRAGGAQRHENRAIRQVRTSTCRQGVRAEGISRVLDEEGDGCGVDRRSTPKRPEWHQGTDGRRYDQNFVGSFSTWRDEVDNGHHGTALQRTNIQLGLGALRPASREYPRPTAS